jgi:hypothetical protein
VSILKKAMGFVLVLAGCLFGSAGSAGDLIIATNGACDYQIVLPDGIKEPIIAKALADAAGVMQEMFQANGWSVPVVKETQADERKPGIYLGDTAVARAAGVETSTLPAWTYVWRVSGRNVIIAGRDWVAAANRQSSTFRPSALGSVKGATDFMRQFCGTRFLAPGGLTGIEFLPMATLVVPDTLSLRKEPMLNFNEGRPNEVAGIALNFFENVTSEYGAHSHELAVPAKLYADTHPEYFALVNGKRIREYKHGWLGMLKEPHLCYSNKDVQELIYQDMIRSFDAGYPEYTSMQADGFQPCECDGCRKLFGVTDWGEKLWLLNRQWAERLKKDRPGKFLVVGAYTVTGNPPATFKEFPPNMRICAGGYPKAFEKWDGYKIPGGFTSYLHAWGGYHLCGYLPVRTPLYAEKVVRMYDTHQVKGVQLDSPPANMWGLEGPTVYVYARMLDDVKTNTVERLLEEYIRAAYGKAAYPMSRLFEELHHTLEAYAEVFGVDNGTFEGYQRANGGSGRYLTWESKLRLIGFIYPPETLALLENQLAQAEKTAGLTDKNRLRLALVRREFDYLKSTARVVHLYNAYQTRLDRVSLDQLLDEMEKRERTIMQWYDTNRPPYAPGIWTQQPIATNWPMYIGGAGHYNDHLMRNGGSYLSTPVPPFTWNIAEMRKAPLFSPRRMSAAKTAVPLSLDPGPWARIPAEKLGPLSLGAAVPQWATEVKAAYDTNALYLRFEGRLQEGWVRSPPMNRDNEEIVTCESFGVVLAPDNNPARYYRLAGGVTNTALYDARHGFIEDAIDPRFNQDDLTWNPEWRYDHAVAPDAKTWSALMVIPFQSLGVPAPASGTEWKVNFGRVHQIRHWYPCEESLWSSNPGTTSIGDRSAFGTLAFE